MAVVLLVLAKNKNEVDVAICCYQNCLLISWEKNLFKPRQVTGCGDDPAIAAGWGGQAGQFGADGPPRADGPGSSSF